MGRTRSILHGALHIAQASLPWSPATHQLFPRAARLRATGTLSHLRVAESDVTKEGHLDRDVKSFKT
eukprot:6204365-Pleurochrysis_carterae.AAC.3